MITLQIDIFIGAVQEPKLDFTLTGYLHSIHQSINFPLSLTGNKVSHSAETKVLFHASLAMRELVRKG